MRETQSERDHFEVNANNSVVSTKDNLGSYAKTPMFPQGSDERERSYNKDRK